MYPLRLLLLRPARQVQRQSHPHSRRRMPLDLVRSYPARRSIFLVSRLRILVARVLRYPRCLPVASQRLGRRDLREHRAWLVRQVWVVCRKWCLPCHAAPVELHPHLRLALRVPRNCPSTMAANGSW